MIRLREDATGAEAEWDRGRWSGDEDFVRRLRVLANIEHALTYVSTSFAWVQARMAERFPAHGVTVVRQAEPEEPPRFDSDGLEIVY